VNEQTVQLILDSLWPLLKATVTGTIPLTAISFVLGLVVALAVALMRLSPVRAVSGAARTYISIIRGTPLLLQLWLLYYGVGSMFPQYPWIRHSELWPYLRQAWPYAVVGLSLSFAGYEGEVMRGAFAGVPRGQLEAARAFGMRRFTAFRRIWLPQAIRQALPTLLGETVLQLKATPLVATITVVDLYAVASRVRQDTFITYEPLLLLAVIYLVMTAILVVLFKRIETRIPARLG